MSATATTRTRGSASALRAWAVVVARYTCAPRTLTPPAGLPTAALGIALGYAATGSVDGRVAALLLTGAFLVNILLAILNDLGDEHCDDTPPGALHVSGGGRVVQDGLVSRRRLVEAAGLLAAVVVFLGGVLVSITTWLLVPPLVVGVTLAAAYSIGPRLVSSWIGEPVIALTGGLFPVLCAYIATAHTYDWSAFLVGVVPTLTVAATVLSAHAADRDVDTARGKTTLATRIGNLWVARLDGLLVAAAGVALMLAVLFEVLPPPALFGLIGLPAASRAVLASNHVAAVTKLSTATFVLCAAAAISLITHAAKLPLVEQVAVSAATVAVSVLFWPRLRDKTLAAASGRVAARG